MGEMVTRSESWRGRRVWLTGHTGFKGGWLSLWLQRLGAEVGGLALAPATVPSFFEVCNVAQGMRSELGDIRDYETVERAVRGFAPEVVFHLAAQPIVRRSYVEPLETLATNVMGTAHVLEACRRTGSVRAVVVVTSDKCYENREWPWGYREIDPMGGHDPYSMSKGCAELVTASWRRSFCQERPRVASVRAGNVIGGGDWAEDRLVPDLVRAMAAGQPAVVRNPGFVRPWQHVLEPLRGYLDVAQALLGEKGAEFAEAWNFAPAEEDARPVRHLADRLAALWGGGASWRHEGTPAVHEAHVLRLDCSKAHARLGWWPRWGLEKALEQTVAWYRAHAEKADMRAVSLAQVEAYER